MQNAPDDTSWWDDLINGLTQKQVPPPPALQPPKVNEDALERSVDQSSIRTLTPHEVGLIVFNETQSFSDRPDSTEPIDAAREKLAHAVINGDLDARCPKGVSEPEDPTNGGIHMYFPTTPTQENFLPAPHNPPGYRIKTHAGPYNNSFVNRDVPSHNVFLNTYE